MNRKSNLLKSILSRSEIGTLIPMALIFLTCLIINPAFFAYQNVIDILRSASTSLIVAIPMTFLLASGAMDLSIGAATSFGGVICAICLTKNFSIPMAILVGLLGGVLVGFLNGIICVKHGMPPFIATLGMQYVLNGLITVITGGISITNWPQDSFKVLGQGKFLEVPYLIIYAAIVALIGNFVLKYTKFGRSVLAVGGNRETAFLAGINVDRIKITCNILASTFAALAGILMAARYNTAQTAAGSGTEMTIMASVIIGGTSHRGGAASILGTILGCILLGCIKNALIVCNVSTYWMNFIYGLILLAALYIDKYRRKAVGLQ